MLHSTELTTYIYIAGAECSFIFKMLFLLTGINF